MKNMDIENILELEGVNAEGYGITSQIVMFDRNLTIQAKGIYAYLCSYLGAGRTTFPKVTTIMSDLKIAKNTFYKHFKLLKELGYIKVSKAKGFLNKNIYTICNNVPGIKNPVECSNAQDSQLTIGGINASGFGFIPKLIMKDNRLTIKAKALVAFLYSIAQTDSRAYPSRTTICTFLCIGKTAYYEALNQLIEYNYIVVKQRHIKHGQFSVNDYILNSNPKTKVKINEPCSENCDNGENGLNSEVTPCPDFCDNVENDLNSEVTPCPDFCDYGEGHRVPEIETLPCPKNCDNNNITSNNNISYNSSSNLKVENVVKNSDDELIEEIKKLSWFDYYSVSPQIEDEAFRKLYCQTVLTLIEMLCDHNPQKYRHQTITAQTLSERLMLCVEKDELYLFDTSDGTDYTEKSIRDLIFTIVTHYQISDRQRTIYNPKKYLKALIWDDINNFFT